MWERTLHQPANGGGFPWSDDDDNATSGNTAGKSDDIDSAVWSDETPAGSSRGGNNGSPPADDAAARIVDAVNRRAAAAPQPQRGREQPQRSRQRARSRSRATEGDKQQQSDSDSEISAAAVDLATRVRPNWTTVVAALRQAATSASPAELTGSAISKVLSSIPSLGSDAALIGAVVHHIGVGNGQDGYIRFLHKLMATVPQNGSGGGSGSSAGVAPAPWSKKTLAAADRTPKASRFASFQDDKDAIKLNTGQPSGP